MTTLDFRIEGPLEEANPYVEKMIKFWKKTKKNLYSFLLTLDIDDLVNISNSLVNIERDNKWAEIGVALSNIGYSIEKGKETGSFETSLEDLMMACKCFGILAECAVKEKKGLIELIDKSYFFDPEANLNIKSKNINL